MPGTIIALASDGMHRFSKQPRDRLTLIAEWGVEGDAHAGATVQHRSRAAKHPGMRNLRQVHLIQSELFADLARNGFDVEPGDLGENVTTQGIDLLALSAGTRLRIGTGLIELTGLRNPCHQIDDNIAPGAMAAVLGRAADGGLVRKAGVMAIVVEGGEIAIGDRISVESAPHAHFQLKPV